MTCQHGPSSQTKTHTPGVILMVRQASHPTAELVRTDTLALMFHIFCLHNKSSIKITAVPERLTSRYSQNNITSEVGSKNNESTPILLSHPT